MERYIIIIIIVLIIIAIICWYMPKKESFDITGQEFNKVGDRRYDLRGYPLSRIDIGQYYVKPNRDIRLSGTGGFVWQSNLSPYAEGNKKCSPISCPQDMPNVYDSEDKCWNCDTSCAIYRKPEDIPNYTMFKKN